MNTPLPVIPESTPTGGLSFSKKEQKEQAKREKQAAKEEQKRQKQQQLEEQKRQKQEAKEEQKRAREQARLQKKQVSPPPPLPPAANRGTGAGGAATNLHGKAFEEKTNNSVRLLQQGFVAVSSTFPPVLLKEVDGTRCLYASQSAFPKYMNQHYGVALERYPDEAYVRHPPTGKIAVYILEKKEQRTEGSVETKLWSGPALKREYELFLGDRFEVHYAYCVNHFLKQKLHSSKERYRKFGIILQEAKIPVLFGDDPNYFQELDKWIFPIHDGQSGEPSVNEKPKTIT